MYAVLTSIIRGYFETDTCISVSDLYIDIANGAGANSIM